MKREGIKKDGKHLELKHYYDFAEEFFQGREELVHFLRLLSNQEAVDQFDRLIDQINDKMDALKRAEGEDGGQILEELNTLFNNGDQIKTHRMEMRAF